MNTPIIERGTIDGYNVYFGRQDQHLRALVEALGKVYETLGARDMAYDSPTAIAFDIAQQEIIASITAVAQSYRDSKWLATGTNYHDKPQ